MPSSTASLDSSLPPRFTSTSANTGYPPAETSSIDCEPFLL
jgi:hypothetical protein